MLLKIIQLKQRNKSRPSKKVLIFLIFTYFKKSHLDIFIPGGMEPNDC